MQAIATHTESNVNIPSATLGFDNVLEQRSPIDLTVHGTIPLWLSGVLYRTGPGTYRIPTTSGPVNKFIEVQHWFDGLGMHHRFEISHNNGTPKVIYRSRKGSEDLEAQIASDERWPTISFGQQLDPCQSIFRKFFTVFKTLRAMRSSPTPSGVNVSVTLTPDMPGFHTNDSVSSLPVPTGGGPRYLVSKTDGNILQLLDPVSLEPLEATSYNRVDPRLSGELTAAHGCLDHRTGDFYNFLCKLAGRFPRYHVFRITKDGRADVLATISDAPASYLHSFAMTEKYVILCVWQAHIKGYGLSVPWNLNIVQSIKKEWDPEHDTMFYVIDRLKGGLVAKYRTPPFFCFHQLNSYDDPASSDIIMDMSIYPTNKILNLLYISQIRNQNSQNGLHMGHARRFRLPEPLRGNTSATRDAVIEFDIPQASCIELPTVHPLLYHRPYRYAYGITIHDGGLSYSIADGIIKLDMAHPVDEGAHKVWRRPGYTPSEPIFVPRPSIHSVGEGNQEEIEDDGVLLSVVLDAVRGSSALVVLDAQTMEELGRAEMEQVFPIGFHGVWTERH